MKKPALLVPFFILLFSVGLSSCGKKCTEGSCKNGGVCVDGECQCPPGFTGADCGDEITPKTIIPRKVKVTKVARTAASGREYDAAEYPDVYVLIKEGTKVWVYTSTALNLQPGQTAEFDVDFLETTGPYFYPSGEYTVELWDNDQISGGQDELMGTGDFRAWTPGNGFPEWITVPVDNGRQEVQIKMEYRWK